MTLYDSRKKTLAEEFGKGTNKCITDESWMQASLQSLNGIFKIYTEDMEWLYSEREFCATDVEETKTVQGVVINAGGIKANVTIDGIVKGTTDTIVYLDAGAYEATISKTGYVSQDIAFVVTAGNYDKQYVTLEKEAEETEEVETTPIIGAILRATLREGSSTVPEPVVLGDTNWFGWEFENVGDTTWKGMVGVKITDETGNIFSYTGDSTKKQSILAKEIKKLWVTTTVTGINVDEDLEIKALLTKTG